MAWWSGSRMVLRVAVVSNSKKLFAFVPDIRKTIGFICLCLGRCRRLCRGADRLGIKEREQLCSRWTSLVVQVVFWIGRIIGIQGPV